MPGLKRTVVIGAAFILPPLAAALLGLRTLEQRDHPEAPARLDAGVIASAPRPTIDPARPLVVVLLGADLTEITDALAPYEMFARAGRYTVVTAAPERQPTLLTGGLRILPHYALAELDRQLAGRAPAIVLVPNIPNIASAANRPLVAWMQRQAAAGALMHSWCKGAMALAHAGLLDGRTATAHWGDIASLEKQFPQVEWVRGVRWIDHGPIVLSAGITSGIDASLRVIGRLDGDDVARRVAAEMRYPDYRRAIDPATEQYTIGPADAVLLANAAFRLDRGRLGIALYEGVGETDLSNVYDAHVHTMVAEAAAVSERDGIVTTAHGMTLLPSLALPEEPSRARALDRLLIPGTEGRRRAASLVASTQRIAPALRAEYLHEDRADRFGLVPVLEDLASTADRATATFALRRMEYRAGDVQLQGSALPWSAIATAILLGFLGVSLVAGIPRLARGHRT
jgi:putative intracellular protease/amidase